MASYALSSYISEYFYIFNRIKTENYLETQKEARKHRDNFRNNVDPILQRDSNFEKHPRPKNETKNYFAQLESTNEVNKHHKKIIPQKINTFLSDNLPLETNLNRKNCKKQLAYDYESRVHTEKPQMIRMIKCKAGDTQINSIFNTDIPIQKERVHRNGGEASEQSIRLAERQNYLPHSIDGRTSKPTKSFDHLHGGQIINPSQDEKIRRKNMIQQKSTITDLLNQDNIPCIGYNCTQKPNSIGIDVLKKALVMNRKMFVK